MVKDSNMATLLIMFLFSQGSYAINIFLFDTSSEENLEYGKMETTTPLPPVFTLCASFRENTVEDTSFFTLFGEAGTPWMTISTWAYPDKNIEMWTRINKKWYKIRDIPAHWLNFWIHVCFHADTISGNISFSFNGEPSSSFIAPELRQGVPKNLKESLFIGLGKFYEEIEPKQFHGQITNFNIFYDAKDIEAMSGNPCKYNGDILSWNDDWRQQGQVEVREEEAWKICNNNQSYTVAITERISWSDAVSVCRKLGDGVITEARSDENVEHIVSLFSKVRTTCDIVWTPIVDKEVEGVFKSSITGEIATYLPWREGKPDGGDGENIVVIEVKNKLYNDRGDGRRYCTSCDISKSTEFSIIGVCKNSYFGELAMLLWHSRLLMFLPPDLKYMLSHTENGIIFRGAKSFIR